MLFNKVNCHRIKSNYNKFNRLINFKYGRQEERKEARKRGTRRRGRPAGPPVVRHAAQEARGPYCVGPAAAPRWLLADMLPDLSKACSCRACLRPKVHEQQTSYTRACLTSRRFFKSQACSCRTSLRHALVGLKHRVLPKG